jgi:hypothetical protein
MLTISVCTRRAGFGWSGGLTRMRVRGCLPPSLIRASTRGGACPLRGAGNLHGAGGRPPLGCIYPAGDYSCQRLAEVVELLELNLVHIHDDPGRVQIDAGHPAGRTLEGDKPAEGDDGDGCNGRDSTERVRENTHRSAAACQLEGGVRRLRRNRPERFGQAGDALPKRPAVGTSREMCLEEHAFELGELGVKPQRKLLASSRAVGRQYRTHSH